MADQSSRSRRVQAAPAGQTSPPEAHPKLLASSIRKAREADAEGILACLRAAFQPYELSYTPAAYADTVLTHATLKQRMKSMCVLVAVDDANHVLGTIACVPTEPHEGHLRGMAVLPQRHGCGIADQLLQAAEHELRGRGCSRIKLNTTEPLKRAVRFYERNGFRPSGRGKNFFGMPLYEFSKDLPE